MAATYEGQTQPQTTDSCAYRVNCACEPEARKALWGRTMCKVLILKIWESEYLGHCVGFFKPGDDSLIKGRPSARNLPRPILTLIARLNSQNAHSPKQSFFRHAYASSPYVPGSHPPFFLSPRRDHSAGHNTDNSTKPRYEPHPRRELQCRFRLQQAIPREGRRAPVWRLRRRPPRSAHEPSHWYLLQYRRGGFPTPYV